ncbi:MAG: DUF4162 domain-containing protein, partial [Myxococcales bacterium]|nr:DUF4162 domain-containing protein [Myxococcales bacterium]
DEAEYCARIGLMVDGSLVALDTPRALKEQYVPGVTLAVSGRDLHRGIAEAAELPGVITAEPFGARVHVRFETGRESEAALRDVFARVGRVDRIETIEASLEDVFLAVVGEGANKEEAA